MGRAVQVTGTSAELLGGSNRATSSGDEEETETLGVRKQHQKEN